MIGPTTSTSSPGVSIIENGTGADVVSVVIAVGTAPLFFVRLKVTIME
jgi:hypothetical protein